MLCMRLIRWCRYNAQSYLIYTAYATYVGLTCLLVVYT